MKIGKWKRKMIKRHVIFWKSVINKNYTFFTLKLFFKCIIY